MSKNKYLPINPKFIKNSKGEPAFVYLDYAVFESLFKEMEDLKNKIDDLDKMQQRKRASK